MLVASTYWHFKCKYRCAFSQAFPTYAPKHTVRRQMNCSIGKVLAFHSSNIWTFRQSICVWVCACFCSVALLCNENCCQQLTASHGKACCKCSCYPMSYVAMVSRFTVIIITNEWVLLIGLHSILTFMKFEKLSSQTWEMFTLTSNSWISQCRAIVETNL